MYTLLHALSCAMIVTTFLGILILEADEAISAERRSNEEEDRLDPGTVQRRLSRFKVDWS